MAQSKTPDAAANASLTVDYRQHHAGSDFIGQLDQRCLVTDMCCRVCLALLAYCPG